ncbi:glycosyltransferase [Cedecea neteri]|uniref:glycosyltransferase family 2 protein n=1 Tax=Cedecea neteri TaxID=158822 RepID=UPI0028936070|nr:glycosyltransferase [Cedecea neteri]WNJ79514.1 glycosyltransferase [Cedecea neteri]
MCDKNHYLLSIIIPTYNNAEFITSTLTSLQSGITDEVEIIIINDGSTDDTDEKIELFQQNNPYKNIKVLHQENQGVAIARNKGLESATGAYIAFVDGDDYVSNCYFDTLLPILRKQNYDLVEFSLTRNKALLHGTPSSENQSSGSREILLVDEESTLLIPIFRAGQWHLFTKIFRRDIIGSDRFEANRRYEDVIFCPFQYFKCKNILQLNKNLYYYRVNSCSITENLRESDAHDIFFAMNKMSNYIKYNNEKRSVATLMIVNCFLEGRKIVRKKKGYYAYDEQMLSDIKTALQYCDESVMNKKIIYKMRHPWVDTFISATRNQIFKLCKKKINKES